MLSWRLRFHSSGMRSKLMERDVEVNEAFKRRFWSRRLMQPSSGSHSRNEPARRNHWILRIQIVTKTYWLEVWCSQEIERSEEWWNAVLAVGAPSEIWIAFSNDGEMLKSRKLMEIQLWSRWMMRPSPRSHLKYQLGEISEWIRIIHIASKTLTYWSISGKCRSTSSPWVRCELIQGVFWSHETIEKADETIQEVELENANRQSCDDHEFKKSSLETNLEK